MTEGNALKRYREARLANFDPPKRLNVWQWAEKHIVLSERTSGYPGRYRSSITPYARGPMEAFTRRDIKGIVCPWCAQSGKTVNIQSIPLAYAICNDPSPALLVLPNTDMARSFSEARLQPLFNDSPEVAKHKPADLDRYKLTEMHFDRMTLNLIGSNSPANLSSRPIRYLFVDEPDKFPGGSNREADALSLAFERTKSFWNALTMLTSTPTTPEGNIWRFWNYSQQFFFNVPCPHCGTMQVLDMEIDGEHRLHWPKDCNIRELDTKAWVECVSCNKDIRDKDKPLMLQHGEWRTDMEAKPWIGFHCSAFYPIWVKFGEIAAEFLRSKRFPDQFQNFLNSWRALPYDAAEQGRQTIMVSKILETSVAYKKNQIPAGVIFLTCGIDVQAHEVWYTIRGWGHNHASWLISWGKVAVETDRIQDFLEAVRGVVSVAYGKPIILTSIDSGWGKRTAEVYAIARNIKRVICTKGRRSNLTKSVDGRDVPLPRPTRLDKYPDGKPIPGGVLLYSPSTSYWKRWFFGRVNAEPPCWFWPQGMDDKDGAVYSRHLESEREVEKRNTSTGKFETIYVVRKGYDDNHLLDCEILASVAAHIVTTSYTMEQLEAAIEKNPNLFIAPAAIEEPDTGPAAPPPTPAKPQGRQITRHEI